MNIYCICYGECEDILQAGYITSEEEAKKQVDLLNAEEETDHHRQWFYFELKPYQEGMMQVCLNYN